MTESFDQAWVLLGVGMVTVFSVLLLVVLIGNTLIFLVNRFVPDESSPKMDKEDSAKDIDFSKMAAIVAGVKKVTGGRGSVDEIRKK